MKLDSRIKDRNHIFDCFGIDEAKQYIGKVCYLSNCLSAFRNLDKVDIDTLKYIDENDHFCGSDKLFAYCLPVELVAPKNEKKYRPYTLEEFQKIFTIGQLIKF